MLKYLALAIYMFASFVPFAHAEDATDDSDDQEMPDMATLKADSAQRHPQPVRVGTLIGQQVLQPIEAQHVIGRVRSIRKDDKGDVSIFMTIGGFLGFDSREIAVPVEAFALLGPYISVLDYTPEQLKTFPDAPLTDQKLSPDAIIRVGLTKPFH